MSKKRFEKGFTKIGHIHCIFEDGKETNMLFHDNDDNINPYCKDGKSNLDRIVDKLNKLSEENELLRLTVSKLDEDNTVYILENRQYKKDIVKYRKENKKLKYINDRLEERLENSGIGVALKMDCDENDGSN